MVEKLVSYFKKNFENDQHSEQYNFNAMEEQKISDIYVLILPYTGLSQGNDQRLAVDS